jgi:alkanesulfonate monooxygenase SsuD/methylene tetrahydromethanopterin reductase-like flavin-dependent oxidoreductase (luciferase family)
VTTVVAANGHLRRIRPRTGVGVFAASNLSTIENVIRICESADSVGVDLLAIEDHLLSCSGDTAGDQYECWSLLSLIAAKTTTATISALVSPVGFRSPAVTAKAAVTLDHISCGRFVLGLGAGWFTEEFAEFGLAFPPYDTRITQLAETVGCCRSVWSSARYGPKPVDGDIPVLIGGAGDKMLSLVAHVGDAWNAEGPIQAWTEQNAAISRTCEKIQRDPNSIIRTVSIPASNAAEAPRYRRAGADLVILCVDRGIESAALRTLLNRTVASVQ